MDWIPRGYLPIPPEHHSFLIIISFLSVLKNQAKSAKYESTQETASIALWQLSDDDDKRQPIKESSLPDTAPPSYEETLQRDAAASSSTNHVMISYQWASQKRVLDINNFLKKVGYNIWIDVENMSKFFLKSSARVVGKYFARM